MITWNQFCKNKKLSIDSLCEFKRQPIPRGFAVLWTSHILILWETNITASNSNHWTTWKRFDLTRLYLSLLLNFNLTDVALSLPETISFSHLQYINFYFILILLFLMGKYFSFSFFFSFYHKNFSHSFIPNDPIFFLLLYSLFLIIFFFLEKIQFGF